LGVFSTKQEAMRREKQILYFKHKKGDKKWLMKTYIMN
jgi:hypothetical protein